MAPNQKEPMKVWIDPNPNVAERSLPILLPTVEQFRNFSDLMACGESLSAYWEQGGFMIRMPPLLFHKMVLYQAGMRKSDEADDVYRQVVLPGVQQIVGCPCGPEDDPTRLLVVNNQAVGSPAVESMTLGSMMSPALGSWHESICTQAFPGNESSVGDLPPRYQPLNLEPNCVPKKLSALVGLGHADEPVAPNPAYAREALKQFRAHWAQPRVEEDQENCLETYATAPPDNTCAAQDIQPSLRSGPDGKSAMVDVARVYSSNMNTASRGSVLRLFRPEGDKSLPERGGLFLKGMMWNLSALPGVLRKDTVELDQNKDPRPVRLLDEDARGSTVPHGTIGTCGTFVCCPQEDMNLGVLDVHLIGAPKVWFLGPPHKVTMIQALSKKWCNPATWENNFGDCRAPLRHKRLWMDPEALHNAGVPMTRVVQQPGDILCLAPMTFKGSFNVGWNVSETVNVAPGGRWLDLAKVAIHCDCFLSTRGDWICRSHLDPVPGLPVVPGMMSRTGQVVGNPLKQGVDFVFSLEPFVRELQLDRYPQWLWGDDFVAPLSGPGDPYGSRLLLRVPPSTLEELLKLSYHSAVVLERIQAFEDGTEDRTALPWPALPWHHEELLRECGKSKSDVADIQMSLSSMMEHMESMAKQNLPNIIPQTGLVAGSTVVPGMMSSTGQVVGNPLRRGADRVFSLEPFVRHLQPERYRPWLWGDDFVAPPSGLAAPYGSRPLVRVKPLTLEALRKLPYPSNEVLERIRAHEDGTADRTALPWPALPWRLEGPLLEPMSNMACIRMSLLSIMAEMVSKDKKRSAAVEDSGRLREDLQARDTELASVMDTRAQLESASVLREKNMADQLRVDLESAQHQSKQLAEELSTALAAVAESKRHEKEAEKLREELAAARQSVQSQKVRLDSAERMFSGLEKSVLEVDKRLEKDLVKIVQEAAASQQVERTNLFRSAVGSWRSCLPGTSKASTTSVEASRSGKHPEEVSVSLGGAAVATCEKESGWDEKSHLDLIHEMSQVVPSIKKKILAEYREQKSRESNCNYPHFVAQFHREFMGKLLGIMAEAFPDERFPFKRKDGNPPVAVIDFEPVPVRQLPKGLEKSGRHSWKITPTTVKQMTKLLFWMHEELLLKWESWGTVASEYGKNVQYAGPGGDWYQVQPSCRWLEVDVAFPVVLRPTQKRWVLAVDGLSLVQNPGLPKTLWQGNLVITDDETGFVILSGATKTAKRKFFFLEGSEFLFPVDLEAHQLIIEKVGKYWRTAITTHLEHPDSSGQAVLSREARDRMPSLSSLIEPFILAVFPGDSSEVMDDYMGVPMIPIRSDVGVSSGVASRFIDERVEVLVAYVNIVNLAVWNSVSKEGRFKKATLKFEEYFSENELHHVRSVHWRKRREEPTDISSNDFEDPKLKRDNSLERSRRAPAYYKRMWFKSLKDAESIQEKGEEFGLFYLNHVKAVNVKSVICKKWRQSMRDAVERMAEGQLAGANPETSLAGKKEQVRDAFPHLKNAWSAEAGGEVKKFKVRVHSDLEYRYLKEYHPEVIRDRVDSLVAEGKR